MERATEPQDLTLGQSPPSSCPTFPTWSVAQPRACDFSDTEPRGTAFFISLHRLVFAFTMMAFRLQMQPEGLVLTPQAGEAGQRGRAPGRHTSLRHTRTKGTLGIT